MTKQYDPLPLGFIDIANFDGVVDIAGHPYAIIRERKERDVQGHVLTSLRLVPFVEKIELSPADLPVKTTIVTQ